MPSLEFICPNCNKKDKITLMGESQGIFEKKCVDCRTVSELKIENNALIDIKSKIKKRNEIAKKVPADYKKYDFEKDKEIKQKDHFWVKVVTFLILTASVMGLVTGGSLYFAPEQFSDSEDIKIFLIVQNGTSYIDNAKILVDNQEINQTYSGNGTYNIFLKPGKYNIKISAEKHKSSTMNVYIPPQDSEISLVDYSSGLEGINSFRFELEMGEGNVNLDENTYLKMLNWCPTLIILFSLIGVWGAWITYTLQSYKNAQIGAFFSIMAMGFLIIGPVLGIAALVLLPKIKKNFTGHFKK
jgi:phage FluMu protein Com